jgi:hypothetical protein
MTPKPMRLSSSRPLHEFVDPEQREDQLAFERVMARLASMTPEEVIRDGVERGVLNPDGTIKRPEGEPALGLPYPP